MFDDVWAWAEADVKFASNKAVDNAIWDSS
jgi:hypothetical protein